ncbi:hypothetical protein EIN_145850 [Entamoeba invadens IP1]|uniref:Uncharacterized protein n=1 Tax=Entamoeba invadens IP1 TaxID=370355 RepID=L7FL44_ENTIV|nr:hypothetical protein EIN_145850 [Entamoeba invadens IP1]ELP87601.1 hypothetical protein EIN_145850 [Entamoeba invadens IP1]|eukprot:XP_004254372.1 hypothetical protein EIN_145850 [Entamoeba invadens IP1]
MTKLENFYLMNVSLYLNTMNTLQNFMLVNKKCQSCLTSLYINPYIDVSNEILKLSIKEQNILYLKIFNFIEKTFPKINTLQCTEYMLTTPTSFYTKINKIRIVKTPRPFEYTGSLHSQPLQLTVVPKLENMFLFGNSFGNYLPSQFVNLRIVHLNAWRRNIPLIVDIIDLPRIEKITLWNCTDPNYLYMMSQLLDGKDDLLVLELVFKNSEVSDTEKNKLNCSRMKKLQTIKIALFVEKCLLREVMREEFEKIISKLRSQNVNVFDCGETYVDKCCVLDDSRFVGEVSVTTQSALNNTNFKYDRSMRHQFDYIPNRGNFGKWMNNTRRSKEVRSKRYNYCNEKLIDRNFYVIRRESKRGFRGRGMERYNGTPTPFSDDIYDNENWTDNDVENGEQNEDANNIEIDKNANSIKDDDDERQEKLEDKTVENDIQNEEEIEDETSTTEQVKSQKDLIRIPLTSPLLLVDDLINRMCVLSKQIKVLNVVSLSNMNLSDFKLMTLCIEKCRNCTFSNVVLNRLLCTKCTKITFDKLQIKDSIYLDTSNKMSFFEFSHFCFFKIRQSEDVKISNLVLQKLRIFNCKSVTVAQSEYSNLICNQSSSIIFDNSNKESKVANETIFSSFEEISNSQINVIWSGSVKIVKSKLSQFVNFPKNNETAILIQIDFQEKTGDDTKQVYPNYNIRFVAGKVSKVSYFDTRCIPNLPGINLNLSYTNDFNGENVYLEDAKNVFINSYKPLKLFCKNVEKVYSISMNVVHKGVDFDLQIISKSDKHLGKQDETTVSNSHKNSRVVCFEHIEINSLNLLEVYGNVKKCEVCMFYNTSPFDDDHIYHYKRYNMSSVDVLHIIISNRGQQMVDLKKCNSKKIILETEHPFFVKEIVLNRNTKFVDTGKILYRKISGGDQNVEIRTSETKFAERGKEVYVVKKKKEKLCWMKCTKIVCENEVEEIVVKGCRELQEIVVGSNTKKIHVQSCENLRTISGDTKNVKIVVRNCINFIEK